MGCFDDLTHTMNTTYAYADRIPVENNCPPPTAVDEGKAVLDAREKFNSFAKTWCGAGQCRAPKTCEPNLSDLQSAANGITSAPLPADPSLKTCSIKITITGDISCECKAPAAGGQKKAKKQARKSTRK